SIGSGRPPVPADEQSETELLREEVEVQKREAELRERREQQQEELKNRVSVAAIVLTTALSFIGNVKGDRNEAAGAAKGAAEPSRAVFRYELGSKLITLALILLSVTILSSKRWLLWAGVTLGSIGLLVAFDGYFLFF